MCTVYFVLAIVLANSYTVYCLLFLKTVNSTKITVKKKQTVKPTTPDIRRVWKKMWSTWAKYACKCKARQKQEARQKTAKMSEGGAWT